MERSRLGAGACRAHVWKDIELGTADDETAVLEQAANLILLSDIPRDARFVNLLCATQGEITLPLSEDCVIPQGNGAGLDEYV